MISINKQPSTSNIDTFRKVIDITFNTLGKMNMSNKQLPNKRGIKKVSRSKSYNYEGMYSITQQRGF